MRLINNIPGIDRPTPVHQKTRMLHEMVSITVPARTSLTSVVNPSTLFLDHIDPHRARSIDDIREDIRHLF